MDLKLLAAKSRRTWHKPQDPETTILEGFLQGRASSHLLCDLFELDWKSCVPILQGLQDAYDRLISEALGRRCSAVLGAFRRKEITLDEAADILFLDTPVAEDILRIGSIVDRKFNPAERPRKKQLVEAINALEALKLACRPVTKRPREER